jgi:hypothetical protein
MIIRFFCLVALIASPFMAASIYWRATTNKRVDREGVEVSALPLSDHAPRAN